MERVRQTGRQRNRDRQTMSRRREDRKVKGIKSGKSETDRKTETYKQ